MPKQTVFALVTFLHDLFTAAWIGGLITLALTVLPAAKQVLGTGPQTKKLLDTIQKRLSVLVYVSIVGLVLTGMLQANRNPAFQGLFSFGNTYSTVLALKHILVAVMVGVALYRSFVLGRQTGPPTSSQERLSGFLLYLNALLGVVALLLSGISAVLISGPPPT